MKSLFKNKWFWILVAVAVVITFVVARSKTGNAIAAKTGGNIIPLSMNPAGSAGGALAV